MLILCVAFEVLFGCIGDQKLKLIINSYKYFSFSTILHPVHRISLTNQPFFRSFFRSFFLSFVPSFLPCLDCWSDVQILTRCERFFWSFESTAYNRHQVHDQLLLKTKLLSCSFWIKIIFEIIRENLKLTCSDEGLTLETSAYNHLHGVKLIHINLRLIHYMFVFFSTPTQIKTSSHRY